MPSPSHIAFNFMIMYFNYSYIFEFSGPMVTGSHCCGIPATFSLLIFTRMDLYSHPNNPSHLSQPQGSHTP